MTDLTIAEAPGIVLAGSGIVTSAGRGPERLLHALACGGRDPAPPRTIESDLAPAYPVFEVPEDALRGTRMPGGRGRRSLRIALAAASDAMRDAAFDAAPERVGVLVGATIGGMNHGEDWIEEVTVAAAGKGTRVSSRPAIRNLPLWTMPNALARRFGFTGPAVAVSTACTSGTQAIAAAADLIVTGVCDVVLAGGVDCLSRLTYHGFAALGVMSQRRCSPFDGARSGLTLGEGAAFVVVAREDAVPRGARLPRLSGWASNTDAHHMTAPRPDGSGVAAAFRGALAVAGLAPSSVGWVHAHGTATSTNDAVESAAVRSVFGAHRVAVSSTKHLFGHTLGAAGAISAVVAMHALAEGFVPGNAAVTSPDPACDVDIVPPCGLRGSPRHAMVSSLGFGGSSCALLVSEPRQ